MPRPCNYYELSGIILQYGKVAMHKMGQRSEYTLIDSLFTIQELSANGPEQFIKWISLFNKHIEEIAKKYNAKTIHWQDFLNSQKDSK